MTDKQIKRGHELLERRQVVADKIEALRRSDMPLNEFLIQANRMENERRVLMRQIEDILKS